MSAGLTLYQPLKSRHLVAIPASELVGSISHTIPSPQPGNHYCPEGEWYCANTNCVVRTVQVVCKLFGEVVPGMRCPACRKRMRFCHWLRRETLVPYRAEESRTPGAAEEEG